jgi:type I restriction enzyme R subunit
MAFNELNSVEHYIIFKLCGVNLNSNVVKEPEHAYGTKWIYKSANDLNRSVNEVLIEQDLREALIHLNPEIAAKPELADEVIYKLRTILISVNQIGLVKANEEFFKWLGGDKTMPFGENNRHVPINLFGFKNLSNNITN